MAPIKFEDKLKDKLENRSLQPSLDAWSTLADRLDKEDKKNNTTRFWWIGIAASLVGVILITTQFYKNTPSTEVLPVIVDTKIEVQNGKKLTLELDLINEVVSNSEIENNNVDVVKATEVASVSNIKAAKPQKTITKEKLQIHEEPQNAVASIIATKAAVDDNIPVKVLSREELKIIEVVDLVKQLQANESSVSDKEIDSLLKQAQREILKQDIFDETTKTVSADALLQDVEEELEHSFRDKVYEALKSSYNSVKTAVAERHN